MARYYSSVAASTTVSTSITSASTSVVVGSVTGYPTSFPYTIVIDPGTTAEELCDVTSAAGTTLSITRGVDGTTAFDHSAGAVVKHVASARDFTDAQNHYVATTGVHGVDGGSIVGTTLSQNLTNKTLTSPSIVGGSASNLTSLDVNYGSMTTGSQQALPLVACTSSTRPGTPSTGQIIYETDTDLNYRYDGSSWIELNHGSWQTYTPTWTAATTNPAIGNGTLNGKYCVIGKTVFYEINLIAGSTTTFGSGTWSFTFPVTAATTLGGDVTGVGQARDASANPAGFTGVIGIRNSTSTFIMYQMAGGLVASSGPFAWTSGDALYFSGTYQAA